MTTVDPAGSAEGERRAVDDPARQLISTDGLSQTLFVEAGAGSGKTTQLVNRIVSLVLSRGVRLAEIAAITFTEAAAAELQARIRIRFEDEARDTTDDVVRQRSEAAIAEADVAAISTLHGFASRVLGEFAIDAHLPPQVRVLDEVSSQLAHEDRWARFVDRLYDDPANAPVLLRAAVLGVALEQRYPGQATFRDVADVLNQNWDRIDTIADLAPPEIGPIDFAAFDRAVAEVAALPAQCTDPSDKLCRHLIENIIPSMTAVAAIEDPGGKIQALRSAKWGPGNGGKAALWGGDAQRVKEQIKATAAIVDETVKAAVDPLLRHLLVLTAREVLDAARARRDDGGLEFHDLLVLARDLLRHSPEVRCALGHRYRYVLLDEFQDTDPIQIDLATLIVSAATDADADADADADSDSGTATAVAPGSWSELPIAPGRLFFVGDPKQSIYRFRRADIALFLAARDRFAVDGGDVRLVTNFRTVEPVLHWVNEFFGQLMAVEVPGSQPSYERLESWRPPSADGDHRPVLLGGPHPDPKVKAGELRDAEADEVTRTIVDIRARPGSWQVQDEGTHEWRDARLSDVTILIPTRTSLPYLRRALGAADIPYRLATGTLVYDTQEVRDALSAIRAIDDPTDQLSLVAALRSPLYACTDVDLFTFHQAGGHWNLRAPISDSVPVDHPVRLALTHLTELWNDRWWSSPADLLERLLRERRADLLAFGDPRPKEVWRRLRFLLDQARSFEEAGGGGGLRGFVEWAELQGADGARVHEPMLDETDDDAVNILTIHGSKGLEFPITILSGMTTRPGGFRQGVSVIWGDGDLPEVKISSKVATADHEPRADLEEAMDRHEKLRLLYVAATRARDHLVVSCHHKAGEKGIDTYAGRVWSFFANEPDLWRRLPCVQDGADRVDTTVRSTHLDSTPEVVPPPSPSSRPSPPPHSPIDDRASWLATREALLDPQREPRVISATAIAKQALKGDAIPDGTVEPRERRRGRAGSAIGRAVHATLELIDFADPTGLDDQVRRQCDIEAIPELVDTVTALVQSALGSEAIAEALAHLHYKELYLATPIGDRVIEGYIDLLIERPDGLVVVDYKTDSANSEREIDAALTRYELQGASYAVALEAVTGRSVVDCRFVFCKASGAIERSVRDLPAAMARVRAAVES